MDLSQKTMDEAFKNCKSWRSPIENKTNRTIKQFKANNGFEFCLE